MRIRYIGKERKKEIDLGNWKLIGDFIPQMEREIDNETGILLLIAYPYYFEEVKDENNNN
jgi:hypothetical protein